MPSITINDQFKRSLIRDIENRYDTIADRINRGLVYRFNFIGSFYNEYCTTHELNLAHNEVLDELASKLHHKYGPYFSKENILRMAAFNNRVSINPQLLNISLYVAWEHIIQLLPFNDDAQWLYYVRLTENNRLNVSELANAIAAEEFEQDKIFLGRKNLKRALQKSLSHETIDKKFVPLWLMRHQREWKPFVNAFKEPVSSSLKPLIEMDEYPLLNYNHYNDENLIIRITHHIDSLRAQLNKDLNMELNLFFWNIGRNLLPDRINPYPVQAMPETSNEKKTYVEKVHFVETAGHSYKFSTTITQNEFEQAEQHKLKKYKNIFDTLFNEHELQYMKLFATKITDTKLMFAFCNLVTWEQIKELLKLEEQESIFELALQIAEQQLNIAQIRELINARLMPEVNNSETNPKIKSKVKFTQNMFFNKKVAVNILHNNLFIQFVNAF